MQYQIEIQGQKIEYEHRVSKRSKSIRLSVYPGGKLVVTTPWRVDLAQASRFIVKKSKWVLSKIGRLKDVQPFNAAAFRQQHLKYKAQALELVQSRIHELNKHYGFTFGKVTIKNHKTLWGSCSKRGNLNFSSRIALLPPEAADYIIVHELCHLKEFNHSPRFWALVAETIPNYKSLRKSLRAKGYNFA
jgi:predicted metal-dependent hydrolase